MEMASISLSFEQLANIDVRLDFLIVLLLERGGLAVQDFSVHVAQGRDPHAFHASEAADVRAAAAVDADDGHTNLIIGPQHP